MRAYFTDLDSTIICSNVTCKDLVCVAIKNGKYTSFMRRESKDKFDRVVQSIKTIPVTTRCKTSYNNILIKDLFSHALVDNGAVLVSKNIIECEEWLDGSYKLLSSVEYEFKMCREILKAYGYIEKWGSDFVLDYFCNNLDEKIRIELKKELGIFSGFLINIRNSSIIITPKCISKGIAINRYVKRFGVFPYLSSGDSVEDESMFKITQYSIGKKNATYNFDTSDKLEFCDFVITKSLEIIAR